MTGPAAQPLAAARDSHTAGLIAAGALTDPAWRSVFATVPRHAFVPTYYRTHLDETGALTHEQITANTPTGAPASTPTRFSRYAGTSPQPRPARA